MPLSLLKQSVFAIGALLALAALGSCNTLKNTAARFLPTGNQTFDASGLRSGTYRLDPQHASLLFTFNHMGFSTVVVSVDSFDATLVFDNAHPEAAALAVTLDPASLDTNDAEFDQTLKGKNYFDVANYPEASFASSEVHFTGDQAGEVPGTLTVHGVSQPVVLRVAFNGGAKNWVTGDYRLGFAAKTTINRSDFGLKNLLALTGDEVEVSINAELVLQENP